LSKGKKQQPTAAFVPLGLEEKPSAAEQSQASTMG
jgi:hypothetical protein